MNTGILIGLGIVVVAIAGFVAARSAYVEMYGSNEMEYRGEKIRLSRKYADYDKYKNDPNNLHTSEVARVETMMTGVRIGPDFSDWSDFARQALAIKFPGYGGGAGPNVSSAGREFIAYALEIPQVAKYRYFVLEKIAGGSLRLVDDFVAGRDGSQTHWDSVVSIRFAENRLIYLDRNSNVVRENDLAVRQ